jgi:two-component system, cell cycle sensor histidine kinase and response regulator CckA
VTTTPIQITSGNSESREDPANWRQAVLQQMLRAALGLGLMAGVPSVYMNLRLGLEWLAALDVVMLLVLIGLLVFDGIPFRWRASVFSAVAFVLGVGVLIAVGSFSLIFFVGAAVIATLLLGVRPGMFATVLATIALAGFGVTGFAGPEVILATREFYATRWIVIALTFLLVATLLTVGVGSVIARLEDVIRRETQARVSLESERSLLRTFIDTLPDVVFTKDIAARFVLVNPATLAMVGRSDPVEMVGRTVFDFFPREQATRIHGDDLEVLAGRTVINREVSTRDTHGTDDWYLTLKAPIRDANGTVTGLIGISRKITERKKLEEQLRQAQKMEAVGQLAGGIAHDFNNLLTIIFGYSDVLRAHTDTTPEIREPVEAINDAASRAADLTRQLLAFSRKSILQPKVLDVNATITNTGRMLTRLIGEHIQVSLVLDPAVAQVRVDPGQLDQVLMNLAVNARDAMPAGGTLRIATQQVELSAARAAALEISAGSHVVLTVSDTGVGMTSDVRERIFEPFFTTKGLGIGTGLGLAMVFGIVRQSGGAIHVDSTPGQGTTFSIFLPVAAPQSVGGVLHPVSRSVSGSELVLLVEDDLHVRELAEKNLRAFGYDVLTASDGREALAIIRSRRASIDLLVTDVVMPHMSGPELAAEIQGEHPDIRVLFMSGYTDDAVVRQGLLTAKVAFLQKPYTPLALADKVRYVLDAQRSASVS